MDLGVGVVTVIAVLVRSWPSPLFRASSLFHPCLVVRLQILLRWARVLSCCGQPIDYVFDARCGRLQITLGICFMKVESHNQIDVFFGVVLIMMTIPQVVLVSAAAACVHVHRHRHCSHCSQFPARPERCW